MGEVKRYAIVEGGIVINVALWDGEAEWTPDAGEAIPCPAGTGIGWTWDGEAFAPPETG
ncbi:hypothetical protein [Propylenella binzhouense]|uniref:hypothetical protein n=1 Tax=Propylenella binzhouense TaxID=2555902 RepID=UPI00136A9987|nr:hypothetical protein [Propylenella binzhouense]